MGRKRGGGEVGVADLGAGGVELSRGCLSLRIKKKDRCWFRSVLLSRCPLVSSSWDYYGLKDKNHTVKLVVELSLASSLFFI
jgi:hypothetical protein